MLAWAAHNRQVLTYEILGKLIGVPQVGLGQLLEPIQSYCIQRKLPPLTILVALKDPGVPGTSFIATEEIPAAQAKVFAYDDWVEHRCSKVSELEDAQVEKQ